LKLRLPHPRAAFDVQPPSLLVKLLIRAAALPARPGAQTPSAARGKILPRERGRRPRLAVPCPLLVDRACPGLLGSALRGPRRASALLDVLVLSGPFCRLLHPTWRHFRSSSSVARGIPGGELDQTALPAAVSTRGERVRM